MSNGTLFVKADQLEVEHESCFTFSTLPNKSKLLSLLGDDCVQQWSKALYSCFGPHTYKHSFYTHKHTESGHINENTHNTVHMHLFDVKIPHYLHPLFFLMDFSDCLLFSYKQKPFSSVFSDTQSCNNMLFCQQLSWLYSLLPLGLNAKMK